MSHYGYLVLIVACVVLLILWLRARRPKAPTLTQEDIEHGVQEALRGGLQDLFTEIKGAAKEHRDIVAATQLVQQFRENPQSMKDLLQEERLAVYAVLVQRMARLRQQLQAIQAQLANKLPLARSRGLVIFELPTSAPIQQEAALLEELRAACAEVDAFAKQYGFETP